MFLFPLCYFFLLCNQISQNLARTESSVLCYFDLLFIKMLWVQINLLCKYLLLFYLTWNGSCRHFDKWIKRLSGFSLPSGITFIPYWNGILQFSASVSLGNPQLIFLWILCYSNSSILPCSLLVEVHCWEKKKNVTFWSTSSLHLLPFSYTLQIKMREVGCEESGEQIFSIISRILNYHRIVLCTFCRPIHSYWGTSFITALS